MYLHGFLTIKIHFFYPHLFMLIGILTFVSFLKMSHLYSNKKIIRVNLKMSNRVKKDNK